MNVLSEKHLQTLRKQTKDANATEHSQPPVTDSHREQAATDQNVNFRTNRR